MRRSHRVIALLFVAGVLAAGCHGDPGTIKAEPAGPAPAVPRWGSLGCTGGTLTTGQHVFQGRGFLVKTPDRAGRDPQDRGPAPLILDLHGLNSSGFEQAIYGRLADAGAARGFTVVEPDSAPGRTGWKLPGMAEGDADIAYVGALLDHLEKGLCIDRRREFAAGFSNGAGLATALVCGLGGRLAGVAAVSGLNLARPCPRPAPTTIVAFHGTADPVVPYQGGEPFGGNRDRIPSWMLPADGSFDLPSVSASATAWGRALSCDRTASAEPAAGVRRHSWTGCRRDARVDLYTVSGAGHAWPGSFPVGAGPSTKKIDATAVTLDAFASGAPRWRGHREYPYPSVSGVGGDRAPYTAATP
ncbi:alpha/beta hydrolase family esterase [Actinomadura gamaensis]|uniref:Alpha/beta hydrolase family esterase n=1 Tax=Actinomadura gamaensis TaxID=1763541 RepID=A0ABV9TXW9_9ACTN